MGGTSNSRTHQPWMCGSANTLMTCATAIGPPTNATCSSLTNCCEHHPVQDLPRIAEDSGGAACGGTRGMGTPRSVVTDAVGHCCVHRLMQLALWGRLQFAAAAQGREHSKVYVLRSTVTNFGVIGKMSWTATAVPSKMVS